MRRMVGALIQFTAFVILLSAAVWPAARATGTDPATIPQPDSAPCIAAATTDDAERIIGLCSALVDNENTARADRIKALIARGSAYDRKDQIDRAIGDYDAALRIDPTLADIFNARGRPPPRAGRFRRGPQAQSAARGRAGQLPVIGKGAGAPRRRNGDWEKAGSSLEMTAFPVKMPESAWN